MIASLKLLGILKKYSLPELLLLEEAFSENNFTQKNNLHAKADRVFEEIQLEIFARKLSLINEIY